MPSRSETRTSSLAVDRIAYTGQGICARLLPAQVTLDELGYPVVLSTVDPEMGDVAIQFCPARALARGVAPLKVRRS